MNGQTAGRLMGTTLLGVGIWMAVGSAISGPAPLVTVIFVAGAVLLTVGGGAHLLWITRPVQAKSWHLVDNGFVTGIIEYQGEAGYNAKSRKHEARDLGLSRTLFGAWRLIRRHQRAVRLNRKCRDCGCDR